MQEGLTLEGANFKKQHSVLEMKKGVESNTSSWGHISSYLTDNDKMSPKSAYDQPSSVARELIQLMDKSTVAKFLDHYKDSVND